MRRSRCTVLVALCASSAWTSCHRAESRADVFDLSDGISQVEASAIAGQLFHHFVGCGAAGDARLVDDHWEVDTLLGYGGRPGPPVLIHAESGVVSWGSSCSALDPAILFVTGATLDGCAPPE